MSHTAVGVVMDVATTTTPEHGYAASTLLSALVHDSACLYLFSELSENEDGGEEGVAYDKLRPTYTHEALVKLMEMGHLKHIISQNGDGLHLLSGTYAAIQDKREEAVCQF